MSLISLPGMRKLGALMVIVPLLAFGNMESNADHQAFSGDIEKYKTGKKIFSDYCSRCHGINADGRGKAIALYVSLRAPKPSNFQIKIYSLRTEQYLTEIVRDGGERHSLSEFMPPFGSELDNHQIKDVVYFIQNVSIYNHGIERQAQAVTANN